MTMVSSVSITTRIFSRRKRQRNNSCNTQRKAPAWKMAKARKEPLHGMRRGHLLRRHLDHCLVALLPLQLIEITQVPARAVEEEVQHLQKQIPHRYPFDALLDPRKFVQQQSYDSDGLQILHEKG